MTDGKTDSEASTAEIVPGGSKTDESTMKPLKNQVSGTSSSGKKNWSCRVIMLDGTNFGCNIEVSFKFIDHIDCKI